MWCRRYYAERVVASFSDQIQSGYSGGNQSVYIEGIALEHFSAPTQTETSTTPQARTRHAMFHSFLYDYRKQDSDITIAHSKIIITFLKQHNIISAILSTIWKNIDDFYEH